MKRLLTWLAVLLLTSACGGSEPEDAPGAAGRPEPIVVYASYEDPSYLEELFADFTLETGIRVTVKNGPSDEQVTKLVDKLDAPNADLLITPDVQGIWRAGDEGALRPYQSTLVDERVPATLRDPDGVWSAVSLEHAQVMKDRRSVPDDLIESYESLAVPELKSKLCLSSSALPINRAVIASLIRSKGRRDAELVVRGWIANLAMPPYVSEEELVAAIAAGTCGAGIVSSVSERPIIPGFAQQPLTSTTPYPAVGNIEAMAISRHAGNPDGARALMEWLTSAEVQARHADATGRFPAVAGDGEVADLSTTGPARMNTPVQQLGSAQMSAAGWFDEEAVRLAERARYQ
ncbi:MAG: extracellular solute-binding protein [Woeseiaceae bacterium]|nr:extracellular solute-binding protein [Woeseiaceae bacterium]